MKFAIKEIHIRLGILVPVPPLEVSAVLFDGGPLWDFEDKRLGIDAYGESKDDLEDVILAMVDSLWHNFAMAKDSELTVGAVAVKNALRQRFRFVGIM